MVSERLPWLIVYGQLHPAFIDTPAFKTLDEKFRSKRDRAPSLFTENYYRAAKWSLLALDNMGGRPVADAAKKPCGRGREA